MLADFTCSCLPLNRAHQFYMVGWPTRVRDLSVHLTPYPSAGLTVKCPTPCPLLGC